MMTASSKLTPVLVLAAVAACSLVRDLDELDPDARALPDAASAGAAAPPDAEAEAEDVSTDASASCPSEMIEQRFGDGTRFCIDRTEVTQAAYAVFLAQDAGPPVIEGCAQNTSFHPDENARDGGPCASAYDPVDGGDFPVVCVDHCDAATYCAWRGVHLCGDKVGRVLEPAGLNAPDRDEWFVACSGTTRRFAPGDDLAGCVHGASAPGPATAPGCSTPDGVLHLSGNVAEWTAACGMIRTGELRCLVRGGSFADPLAEELECAYVEASTPIRARNHRSVTVGFRCCKDL